MDLSEDVDFKLKAPAARDVIRNQISQRVGDIPSLVGTQADVVGLLLVHMLADIVSILDSPENEAQRQRLALMQALAGDVDVVATARATLDKIMAGHAALTAGEALPEDAAILTASVKGLSAVVDETLSRSTKTASILANMQDGA